MCKLFDRSKGLLCERRRCVALRCAQVAEAISVKHLAGNHTVTGGYPTADALNYQGFQLKRFLLARFL
jgi:hypothetical protein